MRKRIYQKCGKLRNVWRMFDDDHSGEVSMNEMQDGLVKLGLGVKELFA